MRQLPVLRSIPAASCAALLVACLHNEGPTTTGPLFATTTIDSTVGTVATTSLVVDVSQHVHVLYSQDGVSTLRYAACAGNCLQATSWQATTIDSAGDTGHDAALAADGTGQLHVTYIERAGGARGHLK